MFIQAAAQVAAYVPSPFTPVRLSESAQVFHAELAAQDGHRLAVGLERHLEGLLDLIGIPAAVEAVVEAVVEPVTLRPAPSENGGLPWDWDTDGACEQPEADDRADGSLGSEASLPFCGTPHLIEELEGLLHRRVVVDRRARDLAIVAKRGEGLSLEAIGAEFGLTRERVRQIVAEYGGPSRSEVKQISRARADAAREALRDRCLAHLAEHPGITAAELADALEVDAAYVRLVMGFDARRLLAPQPRNLDRVSDGELLGELRMAGSLIGGPLTGSGYDRIERALGLHSRVRVIQRFGTWARGCELAGVTPGRALRDNYQRRWTPDEMLDWVARYLAEPGSRGTHAGYDDFARRTPGAPSAQTVRNTIGPWAVIKTQALRNAAHPAQFADPTAA